MKKKLVSISQSLTDKFNPGMRDYIEKKSPLDDFLFVRNKSSIVKITFDDIKFISFEVRLLQNGNPKRRISPSYPFGAIVGGSS